MHRMKTGLGIAATLAALLLAAQPVAAREYALGNLRIAHPNARPTPPGARTGGAYLTIENAGKEPDRLLRAASPAAGAVEIHSMTMEGGMMRMRAIPALDIPPGRTVVLASGGYHVMLLDLKHPLAVGDKVPLTLTFEKAGAIDVEADVEAAGAGAAGKAGGMRGH